MSKVTWLADAKPYLDYHQALRQYLDAFLAILRYEQDNYDVLRQGKKQEIRQYNQLYSSYKLALEEQNQAYVRLTDTVRQYVEQHPEVAAFFAKSLK